MFNLAYTFREQGRFQEGIATLDKAIQLSKDGATCVLRAQFAEKVGNNVDRDRYLQEALRLFGTLPGMQKWELSWYQLAARMSGDQALIAAGEHEQRQRNTATESATSNEGLLPEIVPAIAKVEI